MNTKLLKAKIKESGYKYAYLANQMDISVQALGLKALGKSPFRPKEIAMLRDLLDLSLKEVDQIFLS